MNSDDMIIVKDEYNRLFNRREIRCIFKNAAGRLSRSASIELLRAKLNIDKVIIPIRLDNEYGRDDVKALFYIYDDKDRAKRDLQLHILRRIGLEDKGKGDKTGQA